MRRVSLRTDVAGGILSPAGVDLLHLLKELQGVLELSAWAAAPCAEPRRDRARRPNQSQIGDGGHTGVILGSLRRCFHAAHGLWLGESWVTVALLGELVRLGEPKRHVSHR